MCRAPVYAGRPAGHRGRAHGSLRYACAAGRRRGLQWRRATPARGGGRGECRGTLVTGEKRTACRGTLRNRGGEVMAHRGGAVL